MAEADESDGSFLKLSPTLAVITNIDREHLDYYRDIDEIKEAFVQFANIVPFYGVDDPVPRRSARPGDLPADQAQSHHLRVSRRGRLPAERDLLLAGPESRFSLYHREFSWARSSSSPGPVQRLNCPGGDCRGPGDGHGLSRPSGKGLAPSPACSAALEVRGEANGVTVVDDYGHHPTEIRATLAAARQVWPGRIIVVFQPHRYTRTQALFEEFLTAFADADSLIVTDIYPASEEPIPGVTAFDALRGDPAVRVIGTPVHFSVSDGIVSHLLEDRSPRRRHPDPGRRQRLEGGEEFLKKTKEKASR